MIGSSVAMQSKEVLLNNLLTFRVELTDAMRGNSFREGVLIKGDYGWSEFAPFPHHTIEHSTRWLQAALEMAWTKLPDPKTETIEVNAISTSPLSEKAIEIIEASGCKTIKIKLAGSDLKKDLDFLAEILNYKQNMVFRIDFNGCLNVEDAAKYCNELNKFNVEYVEQPCASLEETALLKKKTQINIAIDETLRLSTDSIDPVTIKRISEIADFVVIKPIPVGGIKRFQNIAEQVLAFGKKVVVSGSMDTSIGLYETALAQSLIDEKYRLVAGGGTGSILSTDVVSKSVKPHNGVIEVTRFDADEKVFTESPNKINLLKKLNEAFYYGRERGWF